mgnify:CR=1 FL=1
MSDKIIVKARSVLKDQLGHPQKFCGTGAHRNWKKQPKGGRRAALRQAMRD